MRSISFFSIVIFLIFFSSTCIAIDTIEEVKPKITAVFQEQVVIVSYFLENTDSGQVFPVDKITETGQKTFVFLPSKSLQNGLYRFTVFATDLVGNSNKYEYMFNLYVPGTRIFLTEPSSIGVANSTRFRLSIYTSRSSVCKYTGIQVSSFDDARLKFFDVTGNLSDNLFVNDHSILDFTVDPEFPRRLFVMCKDDLGRENPEAFTIYSDLTPPTLRSVVFDPSPVIEYPPPPDDLFSVLKVTASEPVICRYTQDPNATYEGMAPFSGFDINNFDAYKEQNDQLMSFPGDIVQKTFNFYVQCEDRARFRSVVFARPLAIDLGAGLLIRVLSPLPFSKNTKVSLNISTNRRAFCLYKSQEAGSPTSYSDPNARLSSSFENLSSKHYKDLGTKSSGSHTISMHCEVPEGVGAEPLSGEMDYTYVIDTTPPPAPKVNATSPVCGNTLSATFSANDTSGISEYRWAVGSQGNVFANGTATEGKVSVSNYNNGSSIVLAAGSSYIFSVIAVDGAGNVGAAGTSNNIAFDATGTSCDKTPPSVTLEKSETGDSVYMKCFDNSSGCNPIGSFFGTAYIQPCNSTQYFLEPVVIPLFKTTIICWSIKDKAGNVNVGSQIVQFNSSDLLAAGMLACDGGIDNDNDGYGERCSLGPDCNDSEPSSNVGCSNGCIQDLDGDGYGQGCIAGNDCNGQDPLLTTKCPNNCISDNDGDNFGLGCDNGPDCKGDDSTLTLNCPNGCIDDNDGDSYGLACPVGFDCNGEDFRKMRDCDNLCIQDTDGDSNGVGCLLGLDCSGRNPVSSTGCSNGCTFDEDGDVYGFGCNLGIDCNGMNPFVSTDCINGCIADHDGDGYGWKCGNGPDCNDTDPNINLDCSGTTNCKYDHDGDSFGLGCEAGPDCDEYDWLVTDQGCTANCTYDSDCDGIDDDWQVMYFNTTICNNTNVCGPSADPDGDKFTNIEEYRRDSDPFGKTDILLPVEKPREALDDDGDGMPDSCERRYGLNPKDPFDANKDTDNDGLSNLEECTYKEGMCINWLNPTSEDTDSDGYADKVEIDAATDPCDPESHPSKALIPILVTLLGLLLSLGSSGYLIYKKYYLPLAYPPKPVVQQGIAQRPGGRPAIQQQAPGTVHHAAPQHVFAHRPTVDVAKQKFDEELKKRADERERLLSVFGARKPIEKKPGKVMEEIARRPVEVRTARVVKPTIEKQESKDDYVSKLSKVVGEDYFDKIAGLSKKEADYLGRLATITKEKKVPLEEDQVSKLASVAKKVADDSDKKREVENAFKKSAMDELETFLSSGKHVDTFVKEVEAPKSKDDSFEALSNIASGKKESALDTLPKQKRQDVVDALSALASKKSKDTAREKIETLSGVESKADVVKVFEQMSKDKHIDVNVFEVLLSYLLKSGKITKSDVSEILFELEKQGVLDKSHVSDVFFNLNIKR